MKYLLILTFLTTVFAETITPQKVTYDRPIRQIQHLEIGAYTTWALGLGSLFAGYVFDGNGIVARDQAQAMYDDAISKNQRIEDVERYSKLRADVSFNRYMRNTWFGLGSAFLLSSSAMYAYAFYLDQKWKLSLTPDGAKLMIFFGGPSK